MNRLALALVVSLVAATPASILGAQRCIDYRDYMHVVGRAPGVGPAVAMSLVGDHLFVALSRSLAIFDVTDAFAPILVHQLDIQVFDLAGSGSYLYAAAGENGLYIVDIHDASLPTVVRSTTEFGSVTRVERRGDLAYLLADGLIILDTTDPRKPVQVGMLSGAKGRTLAVDGEIAAVGSIVIRDPVSISLQIIDVSNVSAPTVLATVEDLFSATAVANGYLFLASGFGSRFDVLDISMPSLPVLVGSTQLYGTFDHVLVDGNRVFLADLYARGTRVLDISDPTQPVIAGMVNTTGAMASTGDRLYGSYDESLQVFDATKPLPPSVVGFSDELEGVRNVALENHTLWTASHAGVFAFDVSNPRHPAVIGGLEMSVTDIAVRDDLLYVGSGIEELAVVDVEDPTTPRVLPAISIPEAITLLAEANGYLYAVTDPTRFLLVFDLSMKSEPRLVGQLQLSSDWTHTLAVKGRYACVAGHRVEVVDITDPTGPVSVDKLYVADGAGGVALDERSLFITQSHGYLHVYELGSRPNHTASLRIPSGCRALQFESPFVYVGCSESVKVIDVSEPLNARFVRDIVAPRGAYGFGYPQLELGDGVLFLYQTHLGIAPAECGVSTPLLLSNLEATVTPDGVRIRWEAAQDAFDDFAVLRATVSMNAPLAFTAPAGELVRSGRSWVYFDPIVRSETTYAYKVRGVSAGARDAELGPIFVTTASGVVQGIQLWPNPVRQGATLRFRLAGSVTADLRVYDVAGRLVHTLSTGERASGARSIAWDGLDANGRRLPSGVYYARLQGASESSVSAFVVVR